jgi:hypothetical protein
LFENWQFYAMETERYAWAGKILKKSDLLAVVLRCEIASQKIIKEMLWRRLVDKEWKVAISLLLVDAHWLAPILWSGSLFVNDMPRLVLEMSHMFVDVHMAPLPIAAQIEDKMQKLRCFIDRMSLHLFDAETQFRALTQLSEFLEDDAFSDQILTFVAVVVGATMQVHEFNAGVQNAACLVLAKLPHVHMSAVEFQGTGLIAKIVRVMRRFGNCEYATFISRTCICTYARAHTHPCSCTHTSLFMMHVHDAFMHAA